MSKASVNKLMGDVQKKYGDNSIMLARDIPVLPSVHSGSFSLDYALGTGGLPPNRLIEVFGQEGSGKTTLGLLSMTKFLDAFPDRVAMVLDLEHKLDKDWMEQIIGSEYMERVLYAQPDHIEQGTNMYVDLLASGEVCFCLFDSVGGAATKASMEKDAEKVQVGGNAPQITKFSRLAATYSSKYECLTFCVNQIREDMEGYHRNLSPGGRALKHAAVARIYIRKSNRDKVEMPVGNGNKITVANKIFATIVKNQMGPEGRVAEWWFTSVPTDERAFGIDAEDELFNLAVATKVITGSGWYHHPAFPEDAKGERKVQGSKGIKAVLQADETAKQTIISEVMAALQDKPELALVGGDE